MPAKRLPTKPVPAPQVEEKEEDNVDYEALVSQDTLEGWIAAKQDLTDAQVKELMERAVIATALGVPDKSKTRRLHGYKVEVVNGTNYNVSKDISDTIFAEVYNALIDADTEGKLTEEDLARETDVILTKTLKYSPELRLTGYKELPDHLKVIFDKHITTKPASAQVKITAEA